eukprot:11157266-Karenia_brevis.AAC.1
MPSRAKILKKHLVVPRPSVKEQSDNMEHQIVIHKGYLVRHKYGQVWRQRRHLVEEETCPGLTIWGALQRSRP